MKKELPFVSHDNQSKEIAMLRPGDILENKYEIIKSIGKGGMSKVWLAKDTNIKLNRLWAVKEISKTTEVYKMTVDEKKALHEIEIMKSLDHPALPRIVDVIDGDTSLCVVMDYIQGITLQGVLEEYGTQKEQAVVTWMLEVCDILTYLHSRKPPIIYRDIKPSNLMLNNDGHIKIIDFGIARVYKGGDDTMPLGSEGYASPEHFTGKTDVRSDVYTVGSTAYALLTGKTQKTAPYYIQPIRDIDPTLSQGLEKIILKATKKDPAERYQTAAELANALESYEKLDDEYISTLKSRVGLYKRKLRTGIGLIVLGAVLFAAGLIYEASSYNSLVASPGGKTEQKAANLEKAISLKPGREEAYIALIEAYAEDGRFTEDESEAFFKVYNDHKNSIDGDTNYDIGEAYLRYYTGETDSSARAKLLTAEPFFAAAIEKGSHEELASGYTFLAECYRKYVMADNSLLTGSETEKDYSNMLSSCKATVDNAANEKMRSITAEATLGLIESQRNEMKENGIRKEEILGVIKSTEKSTDPEIQSLAAEVRNNVEMTYRQKKEEKNA